jgi:hypothetical protein
MLVENGILRIKGKHNAKYVGEFIRYPIILDRNHRMVELLILHFHKKAYHHGIETVVNELRQKVWILMMRNTIKKVCRQCQYYHDKEKP